MKQGRSGCWHLTLHVADARLSPLPWRRHVRENCGCYRLPTLMCSSGESEAWAQIHGGLPHCSAFRDKLFALGRGEPCSCRSSGTSDCVRR
jgi:hypothetical protein